MLAHSDGGNVFLERPVSLGEIYNGVEYESGNQTSSRSLINQSYNFHQVSEEVCIELTQHVMDYPAPVVFLF